MWTSLGIWQNQSQSNRFRITDQILTFKFRFKFTLLTNKLGVFRLNEDRFFRLELMNRLSEIGYSNKQISEFLNFNNIRKIRTDDQYTQKDVWSSLKKYRNRLDRFKNDEVLDISEKVSVEVLLKSK